jgi:hypothetical protein
MASAYKAREKRFKQLSDAQVRADAELIDVDALTPEQQAHVAPTSTWRWRNDDSDRERPVLSFGSMGDAHKGFFVIRDAIDAATQLEIAHACLYVCIWSHRNWLSETVGLTRSLGVYVGPSTWSRRT